MLRYVQMKNSLFSFFQFVDAIALIGTFHRQFLNNASAAQSVRLLKKLMLTAIEQQPIVQTLPLETTTLFDWPK